MKIDEVLENLCIYDTRNPNHISENGCKDYICFCDNCFYGRTELAEEILRVFDYVKKEFHHNVL